MPEKSGCGLLLIGFVVGGLAALGSAETTSGSNISNVSENHTAVIPTLSNPSYSPIVYNEPQPESVPGESKYAGVKYEAGMLNIGANGQPIEGLANIWMADEELNATQSSGLPVDGSKMYMASWRFPLGSQVKVTSLDTGKSVVLTVTDRGPDEISYPGHRFDITPAAARALSDTKGHNIRLMAQLVSPP